jgi:hypothetical protein
MPDAHQIGLPMIPLMVEENYRPVGWLGESAFPPLTTLQYWLFTPELQWRSSGKWRILQGCQRETLGVGLIMGSRLW